MRNCPSSTTIDDLQYFSICRHVDSYQGLLSEALKEARCRCSRKSLGRSWFGTLQMGPRPSRHTGRECGSAGCGWFPKAAGRYGDRTGHVAARCVVVAPSASPRHAFRSTCSAGWQRAPSAAVSRGRRPAAHHVTSPGLPAPPPPPRPPGPTARPRTAQCRVGRSSPRQSAPMYTELMVTPARLISVRGCGTIYAVRVCL